MPRLLPLFMVATFAACENEVPTALDEGLLPVKPVTLEVRLPWSQFATGSQVVGGFGRADEVGVGTIANAFGGTLNARTLLHLVPQTPDSVVDNTIVDIAGDTLTEIVGGAVLLRFDPDASTNQGPVTGCCGPYVHALGRTQCELAAGGGQLGRPGGMARARRRVRGALGQRGMDPLEGDSLVIFFGLNVLATVLDTTTSEFGVRVDLETPGELLQVTFGEMRLFAVVEGIDTVITLPPVSVTDQTFIYDPAPGLPEGLRVGGIPAWRTVISMDLPTTVAGTPEACALVTCPLVLTPERINHAGIVLTTRANEPGFQPTDRCWSTRVPCSPPRCFPRVRWGRLSSWTNWDSLSVQRWHQPRSFPAANGASKCRSHR